MSYPFVNAGTGGRTPVPLWVDTETFNDVDIKVVGGGKYTETCELMIVTWALGNGPVQLWDLTNPDHDHMRDAFLHDVHQADVYRAANAQFDRRVLMQHKLIPNNPAKWQCLMIRAFRCGWPRGGLDYIGKALGVAPEDAKLRDGRKLINMFCTPAPKNHRATRYTRHNKAAEWQRFCEYAMRDVTAMRAAWPKLPTLNDSEFEETLYQWDQVINDRGWPVDRRAVGVACRIIANSRVSLAQRITRMTNGFITSPNQVAKLRKQLAAWDTPTTSLDADAVESLVKNPATPWYVRALVEARYEGSRATNGKFFALQNGVSDDDRIRATIQYGGAPRTLRWAGRGFQPHNLVRPPKGFDSRDIAELLSQCAEHPEWLPILESISDRSILELLSYGIRGVIQARPGYHLVRGDLSQIEARKVNWLAGGQRMLDVFARSDTDDSVDPYVYAAEDIGSTDRQLGKVVTLACGFGMWVDTFIDTAAGYGLTLTKTRATEVVSAWREANPEIVSFWRELEDAVKWALTNNQTIACRRLVISIIQHEHVRYLGIQLPSGRWLLYPHARIRHGAIEYVGLKGWTQTYGGKLVENVTQASSRDVLAHGMMLALAKGFAIVGHVHDEAIAEQPVDDDAHTPALMHDCLTSPTTFTPGLPVGADCTTTKRYAKL